MNGQVADIFRDKFRQVVLVTGDSRVQSLLGMPISMVLPGASVSAVNPDSEPLPSMAGVDLVVVGLSQEWPESGCWVASGDVGSMPPMVYIDFGATVNRAVTCMRAGSIDYIDSNELNVDRMVSALTLVTGEGSESPEEIETTGVSQNLSAKEYMQQREAAASQATDDRTAVSPYLPEEILEQAHVKKDLAAESPEVESGAQPSGESTSVFAQLSEEQQHAATEGVAPAPEEVPESEQATQQLSGDMLRQLQERYKDQVKADTEEAEAKLREAKAKAGIDEGSSEVQATMQLSGDALRQLQEQYNDDVRADTEDAQAKMHAAKARAGIEDPDYEIGPHTNIAPHLNAAPKKGQFEINERFDIDKQNGNGNGNGKPPRGDAPFSGAWLRMPDSVGEQAWPFSAEDIEQGHAILGNYRILEFLGVGGMASVFKAQRISDDRLFAIKLLDPTMAEESVRERFKMEFEILQTIKHKHVVNMEEQVEEGEWIYTVMEYLPGGDLKSRIRRRLKREEAVRYASQIAAALQAAHKQGVLHRDLKPANVLFRSDGTLALVDFGVAKDTKDTDKALTKEGQMVGTPYYASPEQATGAKLDQRSDLYALGIILFEMLEGRRPFVGDTSLQVLMAHVKEPVPLLSQEWDALNDVLTQLLAKDPQDRLADGHAVVQALSEASPGDVSEDLLNQQ